MTKEKIVDHKYIIGRAFRVVNADNDFLNLQDAINGEKVWIETSSMKIFVKEKHETKT